MALNTVICRTGAPPILDPSPEEIAVARVTEGSVVWIDVVGPAHAEITSLGSTFGFHPLALEDARNRHQRPKIDIYDDFIFIVFYALAVESEQIATHEISFFVGEGYIITLHDRPARVIESVWQRRIDPNANGANSSGMLLYTLLDAIVDDYFPIIDRLSDLLDEFEEKIFEEEDLAGQREIFRIKRNLLAVRKILSPERDVMNVLVRRDTPIVDNALIVYFQDVYDHILRVSDAIDSYREIISGALDAQLAITSNRLNQVMKKMTAFTIILMSVTIIASIYGMNFTHMPELGWKLGYPLALGTMVGLGGILTYIFHRVDYL